MNKRKNRNGSRAASVSAIAAMILTLSLGVAGAQVAAPEQAAARAQESYARALEELTYAQPQVVWSNGPEGAQVPQDIRIMQRIVQTALGEVEAPALPDGLATETDTSASPRLYTRDGGVSDTTVWVLPRGRSRVYNIGGRDVSGFYMQGYGYLFTVKWQVGAGGNSFLPARAALARTAELNELVGAARRAAATEDTVEARAAGEAEAALEQERARVEERQADLEAWSAQYRDVLAEALRDVVALYGSTLKRAAPDEAITFIADFGGGESETVTVSTFRGDLVGASRDENLAAVRMAKGETGVSDTLRTELKILAEIIESSLQGDRGGDVWTEYASLTRYVGNASPYQYVPGYGALFRKSARLNIATRVVQRVSPSRREPGVEVLPLREQIDESTEAQQEYYAQHLAELKQTTAEVLATYGPTLTEMGNDEWVGVFYDVGSAAGLLEGGITNYLVQARMGDVRQAGNEADGAAWLLDRLVTNAKQD